jgi:hypothetical protein
METTTIVVPPPVGLAADPVEVEVPWKWLALAVPVEPLTLNPVLPVEPVRDEEADAVTPANEAWVWVSAPPLPPNAAAPRSSRASAEDTRVQPAGQATVERTMQPDQRPSGEGGVDHERFPAPSSVRAVLAAPWLAGKAYGTPLR